MPNRRTDGRTLEANNKSVRRERTMETLGCLPTPFSNLNNRKFREGRLGTYRACHGFRIPKQDDCFGIIFDHF